MNWKVKIIFGFVALTLLSACEKEEAEVLVDSRLQVYFDRFVSEGALRGVTVDFEQIPVQGKIETVEGNNIQGQCQSNSAKANTLIVDIAFWSAANNISKEFVVFHELGHCYLDRAHLDTENSDGTCKSMMHSGSSGCTNIYNQESRSDYLDELFNP